MLIAGRDEIAPPWLLVQMQSAVVLATRLPDEGYTDVAIVDVDGAPLSLAAFQRRHRPELRPIRARRRA